MISFEKYKKELINVNNSLSNKAEDWIIQFAIVKIFSVLESILRDVVTKEIETLSSNKYIKISFARNKKIAVSEEIIAFFKKSSLKKGCQEKALGTKWDININEIQRLQRWRNKIAHGALPDDDDFDKVYEGKYLKDVISRCLTVIKGIQEIHEQETSADEPT